MALAGLLFLWPGRFSLAAVADACGMAAPDVVFAPSAEWTLGFIAACGQSGLASYRDLQLVDLLYPAIGALFAAALLVWLSGRVAPSVSALAAVPLAAGLADYAENVCAWTLLVAPDPGRTSAASALQFASGTKHVLSWATWVLVLVLLVMAAVGAWRGRGIARPGRAGEAERGLSAETGRGPSAEAERAPIDLLDVSPSRSPR
jgi:hypothetical protein